MAPSGKILLIACATFACLVLVPLLLPADHYVKPFEEAERARARRDMERVMDALRTGGGRDVVERLAPTLQVHSPARTPEAWRRMIDALEPGLVVIEEVDAQTLATYGALRDPAGRIAYYLRLETPRTYSLYARSMAQQVRLLFLVVGGVALAMLAVLVLRGMGTADGWGEKKGAGGNLREEKMTEILDLLTEAQEQKMAAMGALAAGVAHEINQPLNSLALDVSGLVMRLERQNEIAPEHLRDRLENVLDQVRRIEDIIQHMRALARDESGAPLQPVGIPGAVRAALNLIGQQLEAHDVGVEERFPEDLPAVAGRPMQMEQVLLNLMVNSMQAMDRCEREAKRIVISASSADGRVALTVSDNGPGLGKDADSAFDPFFTTKDPGAGIGVGLSLVHSFVASWGGSIMATDNEEGGALFTLMLPTAGKEDAA